MDSERKEPNHKEEDFYSALSHEIRRKMLKIIGEQGYSSFTNFKKILGASTGTIYHHLEALKDLIFQEKNKKYYLTTLGSHAYKFLDSNIDSIESTKISEKEIKSPFLRGILSFTPKKMLLENPRENILTIVISISVMITGAILAGLSGLNTCILFFQDSVEFPLLLDPFSKFILSLIFVLNYLIFYSLIELFSWLFYKKSENSFKIFLNFGLVYFPILIYLIIHTILLIFDLSYLTILDSFLLIFFQVWSLWLVTYNLSVNKYIKIERALIISLVIHYGAFIALFLISL